MRKNERPCSSAFCGFTLVEVCLALGIMIFSVTSMLGLFSIGLEGMRSNIDTSQAMNLTRQVLLEAKQMTFSSLAGINTYQRYFTLEGDRVNAGDRNILYTVNVSVNAGGPTTLPGDTTAQPTLLTLTMEIRKTPGGHNPKREPSIVTAVSMLSCSDLSALTAGAQ